MKTKQEKTSIGMKNENDDEEKKHKNKHRKKKLSWKVFIKHKSIINSSKKYNAKANIVHCYKRE